MKKAMNAVLAIAMVCGCFLLTACGSGGGGEKGVTINNNTYYGSNPAFENNSTATTHQATAPTFTNTSSAGTSTGNSATTTPTTSTNTASTSGGTTTSPTNTVTTTPPTNTPPPATNTTNPAVVDTTTNTPVVLPTVPQTVNGEKFHAINVVAGTASIQLAVTSGVIINLVEDVNGVGVASSLSVSEVQYVLWSGDKALWSLTGPYILTTPPVENFLMNIPLHDIGLFRIISKAGKVYNLNTQKTTLGQGLSLDTRMLIITP